jgi:ABC-type lipoprotein export system ATPase subunit
LIRYFWIINIVKYKNQDASMQLALQQLIPLPLRDRVNSYSSGIWKEAVTFNKGEYVFVQAPSGTGKTTLIHILYNLRKDHEGNVRWGDKELSKLSSEEIAQLRTKQVSVIFQDMRLFPDITTWENLEIKRQLTNTISEQTVSDWLERLGLKDKKQSMAGTLSYGEQQRVAIIRALLQPFEWLLMDEPFSHLDKGNTAKAIQLIEEVVARQKAGIVLAELDVNTYFPYTKTIRL